MCANQFTWKRADAYLDTIEVVRIYLFLPCIQYPANRFSQRQRAALSLSNRQLLSCCLLFFMTAAAGDIERKAKLLNHLLCGSDEFWTARQLLPHLAFVMPFQHLSWLAPPAASLLQIATGSWVQYCRISLSLLDRSATWRHRSHVCISHLLNHSKLEIHIIITYVRLVFVFNGKALVQIRKERRPAWPVGLRLLATVCTRSRSESRSSSSALEGPDFRLLILPEFRMSGKPTHAERCTSQWVWNLTTFSNEGVWTSSFGISRHTLPNCSGCKLW